MIRHRFSFGSAAALLAGIALFGNGCTGGDNGSAASTTTASASTTGTPVAGTSGDNRPVATAPGNKAGDTIKIGVVTSKTGANKAWGDDELDGAKMAMDEVNAKGGIKGKKVEIDVGDSASNPEPAKTATELLLSHNVIGIVGEVSSGNTIQIADSAFEKGVPVIAVGATKPEVTQKGTNISRVCYTDAFQGPVMAVFAYKKLGLRKIAVMTDNKLPYSQGLSDSFKATFTQLGGTIVGEKFYETGQTQFSGQLTEIKALNPDGMFCSGYFPEVGPIAQQARAAGLTKDKVTLLGGDGWDSYQLVQSGGDAILGSYFCNHYSNTDTTRPQIGVFLKNWKAAHNGKLPGTTMGALGYDAMALMLDALGRAKDLDSKDLIDAINDTSNYPGVSGDITLKGMKGDPPKRALVVQVVPADAQGQWQKVDIAYQPGDLAQAGVKQP